MALTGGEIQAIAAIAPIVSGTIGNILGSADRAAAERAAADAVAEIERLGAGPDLAREIFYKTFDLAGVLTPELEEAIDLDSPKVAAIKEDPMFKKAQTGALQLIGERAKTGFGVEDRAGLAEIQLKQARDTQAKIGQILQSYQQRGLGGAGPELAAQLQAASAGAAQAGEEGLKLQAQAQLAALEAASRYGALGGQIRGQEFDIARTKAAAEDETAMARFKEATSRQQRNVATRMNVQQQNLANRQRTADLNVAQTNEELLRQRQAEQQMYDNQVRVAQLRANARLGQSTQLQEQAAQTGQMYANIGAGTSRALAAYGAYGKSSDKKDENEDDKWIS